MLDRFAPDDYLAFAFQGAAKIGRALGYGLRGGEHGEQYDRCEPRHGKDLLELAAEQKYAVARYPGEVNPAQAS
jgi:hypothetical protein